MRLTIVKNKAGNNLQADNIFLCDKNTIAIRSDTLQFGPPVDLIANMAKSSDRLLTILDCGCGSGQFSAMLKANNIPHKYTGLDYAYNFLS